MYFPRDLEKKIRKNLDNDYILLILGARQTGKTTLLKQIFQAQETKTNSFFINLENPEYKALLNKHPQNLYKIIGVSPTAKGAKYRVFIDEIQYLDNPSNFLKFIYDEYGQTTKLIVTGSSAFYLDRKFKDSLMGRKKIFHLYTLNFGEFLRFKEEKKLSQVFKKSKKMPGIYKNKFEQMWMEYVIYGGYPRIVLSSEIQEKRDLLEEITFDYIKKDIFEANIQDEEKYFHLLKILASQCGQLVNVNELANTLNLSQPTIENYLYVMQKSFHIALIKPFYSNLRKELSKMRKVYFYDLGIRNQFLGDFDSIELRKDKGAFLENIFFRETLFREKLEHIKYWRTLNKNEVDFVVDEKQAYEIKFRESEIRQSKYKAFRKAFPEIKLEFVTSEDFFEHIYRGDK